MYRNNGHPPGGAIAGLPGGGQRTTRVLDKDEKSSLIAMYRKMGLEGVRRHLQTSGWHNALGDPAVRAFAYEWLESAAERGERSGVLQRATIFGLVVLFGATSGYFIYSTPELSYLLGDLLR